MAQSTDNTLSNQSGASFRTELNSILGAHLTSHKGSSEPSYITTGGLWIDDTSTPWVYKIYDGAASFGFLEINPSTNNVTLINVKDGDARTEGASIGQIQDSAFHVLGSVSGTNTITASLTPAITAYAAGQSFNFVVGTTNTGAVTINVNSLGAKAIQKNGAALVSGDLTAGDIASIIYDGTQFQLVSPARTPVLTNNSITTAKINNDAVTNAKLANMATQTIKGRNTAGTGDPEDLTATQARALLDVPSNSEVNANTITPGAFGGKLLHIQDQKTNGSNGGGSSSGSFSTRVLNTVLINEISGASLSSNQITLPAGTYYLEAESVAMDSDGMRNRIRNITDGTTLLLSLSEGSNAASYYATVTSRVGGRFTLTAEKVLELQYFAQLGRATDGLGQDTSSGEVEVFADIKIWKVG